MPPGTTIDTESDLAAGIAALIDLEPRFDTILDVTGTPPLRRRPGGFEALLRLITDQMISLQAADAIWSRMVDLFPDRTPETIVAMPDDLYRRAGQSAAKVRTMRALGCAMLEGSIDLDELERASDDEASRTLRAVSGIGPWTADLYLLTCLGRRDVWPHGDAALRTGASAAFGGGTRIEPAGMMALAEPWRPWRSIAARFLWAYSRHV